MKLVSLAVVLGVGSFAPAYGCSEPPGADHPWTDQSGAGSSGSYPADASPSPDAANASPPDGASDVDPRDAGELDADGPFEPADAAVDGAAPDRAALLVSAPSARATTELGGQITFTVRLGRAPLAPVEIPVVSSDPSEASVAPGSLVFTAEDWNQGKVVTVTGLPDDLVDGTLEYTVNVGPAASTDEGYTGLAAAPVSLANEDHPLPGYRAFDINHLLVAGQSNAIASSSHPPPAELTGPHPTYGNLSFDVGVMTAASCDGDGCRQYEAPTDFVPLREGDVFSLSPTPRETLASSMANQASFLGSSVYFPGTEYAAHDVLVSIHGRSGNPYHCLRFGGCTWYAGRNYVGAFDEGLRQVRDAKAIATSKQKTYAVRGVAVVHGESDHNGYANLYPRNGTGGAPNAVKTYADALVEWQSDYEREVQAITGQVVPVPLYVLQLHWTGRLVNEITIDQYDAHLRAPGKVIVAAPSYMLQFRPDCLHYTFGSQRRIGEYLAKAYAHTVFTGKAFEPLRPLSVARDGNVVTVRYHVPVPPLVFDTVQVTDPGNYGFTFVDDGNTARIVGVELAGPDAVRITLDAAPTGANQRLLYAVSTDQVRCAGPSTGVRGNLRDSDSTPSQRGDAPLVNWGIGFRMRVP